MTTTWMTPPQVAKLLGIDPGKVVAWIRRGELVAVNVAESTEGRPRYRISPEALEAFFSRRQAKPTQQVRRRRTRFTPKYYL